MKTQLSLWVSAGLLFSLSRTSSETPNPGIPGPEINQILELTVADFRYGDVKINPPHSWEGVSVIFWLEGIKLRELGFLADIPVNMVAIPLESSGSIGPRESDINENSLSSEMIQDGQFDGWYLEDGTLL